MASRLILLQNTRFLQRTLAVEGTARRCFGTTSVRLAEDPKDGDKKKFQPDTTFTVPKTTNPLDLLDLHPSKIKTAKTASEQELIKKQEEATEMWWKKVQELEKEFDEAKKKAEKK